MGLGRGGGGGGWRGSNVAGVRRLVQRFQRAFPVLLEQFRVLDEFFSSIGVAEIAGGAL